MYFRRLSHESAIKQKDIMSQKRMELKHRKEWNSNTVGFSEQHICHRKNVYNSMFSRKVTRMCFMRPKEVRDPKV